MIKKSNPSVVSLDKNIAPELQDALLTLSTYKLRILVTGAGGFLGGAICKMLRLADIEVIGFARSNYPQLGDLGVTLIKGDLNHFQSVSEAVSHCDLVFHVASKAGVWGSRESYFETNVNGTENIIQACKEHGVKHLVYTSTPSVTFSGKDEEGIDESTPHASHFLNYYGESKSIAEKNVLKNNDSDLKTTALRPHLIWGPGDPHLAPRVFERAMAGRLKLVGRQDKLVDTIYIDNAVYAHILAALDLLKAHSKSAGKAYFLSNDQPITMAEMLNKLLACKDLPLVNKRVPSVIAYFVGSSLETIYSLLKISKEPVMTRFVARQLSTSHYFNISAAKQDFGYQALVSIDQGMENFKEQITKNR